ncbi:MAG: hypothetical protein RSC93_02765 [Erysipelotrichaceae bacterium]
MLTLKNAFRYQNYLSRIMESAIDLLNLDTNLFIESKVLNFSKTSFGDDVRETEEKEVPFENFTVIGCVDLIQALLEEKHKLSQMIQSAKREHCPDFDSNLSYASDLNRVKTILSDLVSANKSVFKGREQVTRKADDGTAVTFYVETKQMREINYNRNVVRAIYEKTQTLFDDTNEEIDKDKVQVLIDFEPKLSFSDTLESAFNKLAK